MELQNSAGGDAVRPNVLRVIGCSDPWRVDTGPRVTDANVRFAWNDYIVFSQNNLRLLVVELVNFFVQSYVHGVSYYP